MWKLLLVLLAGVVFGQEAPPNGPRKIDPAWHALVHATVHVEPGKTLDGATVVLRNGTIEQVGGDVPVGARVWDYEGLHVFAGFVDAYVEVEGPPHKSRHWNRLVTPRRTAREIDDKTATELRKLGFCAAAASPKGGIFRGRASLVSLAVTEDGKKRPVYREAVYQSLAFERGGRGEYPTAQMGSIALIRQTLHDGLARGQTLAFSVDDELEALRAAKIAREFERPAVLVGSGMEFKRLDAIKADGLPVVVPLRFPRIPKVDSFGGADATDLRELMAWEQAPTNPRRLDAAGLKVALTSSKVRRRERFWRNLQKAARHGLKPDRALAMLTTNPAEILRASDRLGTIAVGKLANLVVTDGPLLARRTKVREVWIDGERHEIEAARDRFLGEWTLLNPAARLRIEERNEVTLLDWKEQEVKARHVTIRGRRISFVIGGLGTLSGVLDGKTIRGHAFTPEGRPFLWAAEYAAALETQKPVRAPAAADVPESYGHPFGPYALAGLPKQRDVVLRGATLWTCGREGVVEKGDLVVKGGKIAYAGPRKEWARTDWAGLAVVDVSSKHITPGIVDCHSHTGISKGINDSGQAVTAEVRIGDVTNPDTISWYRQLAGGVTTVNSLHGSANPIGGQNQVNKVRWGVPHPDQMHFAGAIAGIKFALGENVKQSNWGDDFTTRYPQTRMGVESLMRDRFLAAREYSRKHDRVDLELEALGEVLKGERLVHCHSYRQDEILMLCRIAEEFGFKIGTFQHVLEGYKVAEAIKVHAIGASAFSDWWAYKVEVQDAIPENGAIMHEQGVVVSFNSDSNDLCRRLNVEAAKAVKYGGLKPSEALRFVTINPAIQLQVDDRVGSLENGKDADLAIWSGDPLSTMTRCEATWIDGREYFSLEQDARHREWIAKERSRLIQKALGMRRDRKPKDEDEDEEEIVPTVEPTFHCGECGR